MIALLLTRASVATAQDRASSKQIASENQQNRALQAYIDAQQKELKKRRERVTAAYDQARREHEAAAAAHAAAKPNDRPTTGATLKAKSKALIEAAFAAYDTGDAELKAEARKDLLVDGLDYSWKEVLDAISVRLRDSQAVPDDVVALFDALDDKIALARKLSDPASRERITAFLRELKATWSDDDPPPIEDAIGDFGQMMAALQRMSEESYRYVAKEWVARFGTYDPRVELVRDRLVVAYVIDPALAGPYADGFKQKFSAWMRAASSDHVIKERVLPGLGPDQIAALMVEADRILTSTDAEGLPPCVPEQPLSELLCIPAYNGVIVVELRETTAGPRAFASWRVREEGQILRADDRYPDAGLELVVSADARHGRLYGERLATDILASETLYAGIAEVIDLVPERVPPPHEPPPPWELDPKDTRASALSAAAWSGSPWLMDGSAANDTFGNVVGIADVILLVGGIVGVSLAVEAHQRGDASDDAWITASAVSFSGAFGLRLVSGVAYVAFGPEEKNTELALRSGR